MLDVDTILNEICSGNPDLLRLLRIHSACVARKALEVADRLEQRHPGILINRTFIHEAAMLHDVGIVRCHAPSIFCFGTQPYICHGIEGRKMLEARGLPRHALVCERHTGAGLTIDDILTQHLPLPLRDMTPQSIEERIICYADKFFSKSSHPEREKTLAEVDASMARHGTDSLRRFHELLP